MGNERSALYSNDRCIHQMFETQVEQTPDAVAVAFENKQLTYRQLNHRANQLAHHLRSLGVGPEVLVGICMERSVEMVVGLLGILKAGGAYVPLDPVYPIDRLAFILEDTQAPVMLIQEQLIESLPAHGAQVVCLDSDWGVIAQNSQENLASRATTDNLVYVIYTSGSTGQPKGVMISHRGICNQLCWRQTAFPLTETDRVLQTISFSFDPSVWQIFWPLSFGAQLIVARPGGHQDSAYLVKLIAQQQITVIALVPSMLRLFLEEKGIETCKCLRHVTCGGEALPIELIERFFARLNLDNVLHNCYGPTEASIDATFWSCKRGTNQPIAPIGRPIANTQIYILDSDLQPVPVGEPGELHIGGIGLARGYLNRPELTAEKFIPNPFSDESGARLYKTGDLARYLPDGNIEFLGRIDHQVKIRGFRIELEEIEAALIQHPAVRQSVVISREDVPGDKRLVAYVVPSQEPVLITSELRRFLKEKLPDYMVPSAFVILEALPLTPNGKVDRLVLPEPDQKRPDPEKTFVPPLDTLELQLTKIWEKILGIQPIGVRDNFFELGGHSLLAVRLLSEIEKVFGKNLPLATFFEAQTVEQLTSILRQEERSAPWQALVMIQPGSTKPPLFCIHAVWGNVLFYRNLVPYLEPDQPFYGLQAQGLDGKQAPCTSVTEMAANYIQEIRTVQAEGPYFLGGFSFGGLVAFEIARQLHAQGQKIALLAIFDTAAPGYSQPTSDPGYAEPLTFWGRLFFHLRKLVSLRLKDQLTYVWERVAWHLEIGKLSIFYRTYLRYIRRSPQDLRFLNVAGANHQAGESYVPQVYPGRLTLLRSSKQAVGFDDDAQLGWGELVAGGVEIHEIPGSHTEIMEEPKVRLVAEKLKLCLDKNTVQLNLSST